MQKAVFRLRINELGEIDEVIVDESFFSEKDIRILIEEFKKMKFTAAEIKKIPVKSEMRIQISVENLPIRSIKN
jgi:hypothetical protein